jgi:ATP-dependent DNA helicase RecQ
VAKDRSWEAYKAIERFMSDAQKCRRRQILDHFGDVEEGAPTGRCCDLCDLDEELARVLAKAASSRATTRRSTGATANIGNGTSTEPVDEQQFEKLRAWRWQRAQGKPAYTVAANAVLEEILRARPRSIEALMEIRGIGPALCEKHGDSLLQTLSEL